MTEQQVIAALSALYSVVYTLRNKFITVRPSYDNDLAENAMDKINEALKEFGVEPDGDTIAEEDK